MTLSIVARVAGWQLNPFSTETWENEDYVADDGQHIARVETFEEQGPRFYPHAFDPVAKQWVRGGCFGDLPNAKAWAERHAGISPLKPGEPNGAPFAPSVGTLDDWED
jgi:hypothetical protein